MNPRVTLRYKIEQGGQRPGEFDSQIPDIDKESSDAACSVFLVRNLYYFTCILFSRVATFILIWVFPKVADNK